MPTYRRRKPYFVVVPEEWNTTARLKTDRGPVEGGGLEQRVRTQRERLGELLSKRPKARVLLDASTESEWVARCLEG